MEDSWEGRMAAKAAAREAERSRRQRALDEAERQAYAKQLMEEQRGEFDAGPENGCRECYIWAPDFFTPRYYWAHVTIEGDDPLCHHGCHGDDPPWCGVVVIG